MSGLFRMHGAALMQASLRHALKPMNTLLSALVIAIALMLPALGYVLLDSLGELARGVSGKPEISIFLNKEVSAAQLPVIENRLRTDKRISALRFIPRDTALKQLATRGGFADVTGALSDNPLPDAFVLEPANDSPKQFAALKNALTAMPEVAFVQLDSEWVDRLHALIDFGRALVLLLGSLLGTALVIVTFNTIRLQILTLRHEISVSLLLGATRPFVRRPFLYYGLIQGVLGGLLAWGGLLLFMQLIGPQIQSFAQTYNIVIDPRGPEIFQGAMLCAFAALLGWLGAGLSVFRHLKDGPAD